MLSVTLRPQTFCKALTDNQIGLQPCLQACEGFALTSSCLSICKRAWREGF